MIHPSSSVHCSARCLLRGVAALLVLSGGASLSVAADKPASALIVTPASLTLRGNFSQAQLVVTAANSQGAADQESADLTHAAKYQSADPQVATVNSQGRLLAHGNGKTIVRVTAGGKTIDVPVEVTDVVSQPKPGFTESIAPLLSKAGCNAAACHAAQYGKGGFKLSVFGFAPDDDYTAIVRDRQGRRANLLEPEKSLFLLKPTMKVPHGGNRRLSPGTVDYDIIRAWLAGGAPAPKREDPQVTKIEVFPPHRVGAEGFQQQLRVEATYADGRRKDVTAWARFDSMDEGMISVSTDGLVTTTGRGQAPVMVRFEGQAEVAMIVVPYDGKFDRSKWKSQNFVDDLAAAKFAELGINPSGLCDDATFLRRALLDAVGGLPSIEETKAFLASKDPQKREKLVDRLLGITGDPALDTFNDRYAAFWSVKWADLIRSRSDTLGEQGMWAMHNWLLQSFRENKPMDRFVRELITASGSIYRSGPANYYRTATSPEDLAETTAQLFMGVRLQCARCHHHPFEKYSQEDYYSFAAFFSRVGTKTSNEFGIFGREQVVLVRSAGETRHPRTGQTMKATPLDGEPAPETRDRRQPLADWLVAPDNHFFARNLANRYVAYLLGRGLVEPVDDMRATNAASNRALLDALAKTLVDAKYDVKQLIRAIMVSRLYQLDSQPTAENQSDSRFYSHYKVKRISAEPLLDAVDMVTGVPTKFPNLPLGTRAIELPDAIYNNYFLTTFGKPRRESVCECERAPDENLAQALHTLNGDTLATKIADKNGRVAKLLAEKKPDDEVIRELYLASLAREPDARELEACRKLRKDSADAKAFYEDLLWSLLNSKHFLFVR